MTALLMGTAGHIDHGKTALIRALTGVDLDRLEEEKRRGITIELGFVALDLGGGERIGVVDVPGHERFIKTMVAGAQGIDMVLLVIAADEGVMPQTVEHLDICRLLGVRKGIIALTKSDKADGEMRMLATDEIQELIKGSFLEGAPIVSCSAVTNDGIEELRKTIADVARSLPRRSERGMFRMPIDRSFSVKGFGTVVTGSVIAGNIKKGDDVEIIPGGRRATVRELEVHGEKVDLAGAGQRLAVNLAGVERAGVGRGMWLARPGSIKPTRTADVRLEILKTAGGPLHNGLELLAHAGTAHVLAEIDLFGNRAINPGDIDVARLHFKEPMALLAGDRIVLRSFARQATVAGGLTLDPLPGERVAHRGRRGKRESPQFLIKLDSAKPAERIAMLVVASDRTGTLASHLIQRMPLAPEETAAMVEIASRKTILKIAGREELLIGRGVFDSISGEIVEMLRSHHRDRPMETGLSRGALKGKRFRRAPDSVYAAAIESLIKSGRIESDGDLVRLKEHKASAGLADQGDVAAIEKALKDGGFTPPAPAQIAESLGRDKKDVLRLLKFLTDQNRARRISEDLFYLPAAIDEIKRLLESYLAGHESIGPVDFKGITGTSRKFAIALLEYFDRERVTIRVGDKRILRHNPGPKPGV